MQIVVSPDLNLAEYAGRKIWMLGFTKNKTRILNPVEVFLYVEAYKMPLNKKLSLVRLKDNGDIIEAIDINTDDKPSDDGTFVFLAESEDALFRMPEIAQIQFQLVANVAESLRIRYDNHLDKESLFFNMDKTFDSAQ